MVEWPRTPAAAVKFRSECQRLRHSSARAAISQRLKPCRTTRVSSSLSARIAKRYCGQSPEIAASFAHTVIMRAPHASLSWLGLKEWNDRESPCRTRRPDTFKIRGLFGSIRRDVRGAMLRRDPLRHCRPLSGRAEFHSTRCYSLAFDARVVGHRPLGILGWISATRATRPSFCGCGMCGRPDCWRDIRPRISRNADDLVFHCWSPAGDDVERPRAARGID